MDTQVETELEDDMATGVTYRFKGSRLGLRF